MALALLPSSLRSARVRAGAFVRSWTECALNLAFPWPPSVHGEPVRLAAPFCRRCGFPYPALQVLETTFSCADCNDREWYFEMARAAYRTTGQVRESIIGFKYGSEYYQRTRLIHWLTEAFDDHLAQGTWDALVPVPLHKRRRRSRGFNQAAELANGLSKSRKKPVVDCLYRYRETDPQVGLEREARRENMAGAFRLKRGFDVRGRHLLLIDDVFTTGATVNACAQVLAEAGATRLAVLTVSRS